MEPDAPSLRDALARVDALREEIDALRPLPPDTLGRAMQRLRLEWTYHSNAIEGNSLDYGETRALLLHGVTAHGKPLKDHLDIRRHREVLEFLEGFVQSDEPLTLAVIRELHRLLMGDTYEVQAETPDGQRIKREERGGEFKAHPNHVRTATGETHYYATPEETPARMTDLMDSYSAQREQVERGELHPVVLAATLHHGFVEIHPFPDGNGRLSRVLMNLLLMRAGYPPAVIRQENRSVYFGALAQADAGDVVPFIEFVMTELEATMELYLRALRNEPDPDAFGRRVALLKREVKAVPVEARFDMVRRAQLAQEVVIPLIENTAERISELRELFGQVKYRIDIIDSSKKAKSGNKAFVLLKGGDWFSVEAEWNLLGLNVDPFFSTTIFYKGNIVGNRFDLMTYPPGATLAHYASSATSPKDMKQVVDGVFEPVLSMIEKAVRSVEGSE
jgi:Fic family protein